MAHAKMDESSAEPSNSNRCLPRRYSRNIPLPWAFAGRQTGAGGRSRSLARSAADAGRLSAWLAAQPAGEADLKPVLRRLKQRAYARIATRDLAGLAPLGEVVECMTLIAELAVARAVEVIGKGLASNATARRAAPTAGAGADRDRHGQAGRARTQRLLRHRPDLRLSRGRRHRRQRKSISNFEFFTRLASADQRHRRRDRGRPGVPRRHAPAAQRRLRPAGLLLRHAGKLLLTQGREWERYAWIKARAADRRARRDELEAVRRPFVFRKYLDFGAINAMRELHAQIRREVAKKDMADNVKLGPAASARSSSSPRCSS
jgi:glutamate-ammonia-ligase adenylyltransferase